MKSAMPSFHQIPTAQLIPLSFPEIKKIPESSTSKCNRETKGNELNHFMPLFMFLLFLQSFPYRQRPPSNCSQTRHLNAKSNSLAPVFTHTLPTNTAGNSFPHFWIKILDIILRAKSRINNAGLSLLHTSQNRMRSIPDLNISTSILQNAADAFMIQHRQCVSGFGDYWDEIKEKSLNKTFCQLSIICG